MSLSACNSCGAALSAGSAVCWQCGSSEPFSTAAAGAALLRPSQHPAVGQQTAYLAQKVTGSASIVVSLAWFSGVVSVLAGILSWVASASLGQGVMGFFVGAVIAVYGLIQATFLSLIGRYAEMRAAQAIGA